MTSEGLEQILIYNPFEQLCMKAFISLDRMAGTLAQPFSVERPILLPVPRVSYRRMMFNRLKEYFLSRGKPTTSLAKAAYWDTKWKTEFPDEFRNSMDRTESTATYVEYISSAVGEGGCQISESDIYSSTANRLNTDMGSPVSGRSFGLDSEAYDIGTIAGFILRLLSKPMG